MFEENDRKPNLLIILCVTNVIFIIWICYLYVNPTCNNDEIITNNTIVVQISGEVNNPNVYEIKDGLRLNDLIEISGGFTEEANMELVNLALKLTDEMKITIPNKNASTESEYNQKININTASLEILTTLNGIGDVIGQRIIDYRETHGYFKSIEEIQRVSGIGDKTYGKIKDYICI